MNEQIEKRVKKAVNTIHGLNVEGGRDFSIVVGKLLGNIENPDTFEKSAIEFYNKYFKG